MTARQPVSMNVTSDMSMISWRLPRRVAVRNWSNWSREVRSRLPDTLTTVNESRCSDDRDSMWRPPPADQSPNNRLRSRSGGGSGGSAQAHPQQDRGAGLGRLDLEVVADQPGHFQAHAAALGRAAGGQAGTSRGGAAALVAGLGPAG